MKSVYAILPIIPTLLLSQELSLIESLHEDMKQSAYTASLHHENIDYEPYILSVYNHDDLFTLGIGTLGEALLLVPGVDMSTNNMNNRTLVFRGSNPKAFGQSTLVIDGITVNDTLFNSYNGYLDLPIELIERIEIVRGSGSFISGVNGYAGTINVITRRQTERNGEVFASSGSQNTWSGGGWHRFKVGQSVLNLDAFIISNDHLSPITVTDQLNNTGIAHLGSFYKGASFNFNMNNFEIQGRINQYSSDAAFGQLYLLPSEGDTIESNSWYLQGSYNRMLSPDSSMTLKAIIKDDVFKSDSRIAPEGTYYEGPFGPIVFTDGEWAKLLLKTRHIAASAELLYDAFERHSIVIGMEFLHDKVIGMRSVTTDLLTGVGMVDYTDTPFAFFNDDKASRSTRHWYLSDKIDINDQLAMTAMAGFLEYSDLSSQAYGRVSLVYQPTTYDIFKIMAGNSVRPPSFQELYVFPTPYAAGNPDLESEKVRSYETQYLHKFSHDLTFDLNLFYLINSNQIVRDETNTFQNNGRMTIRGAETELRGHFSSQDIVMLSYSYIDTEGHNDAGDVCDSPYAASHLLKASYAYTFDNQWTLSGIYNYVGSKKRDCSDTRDALQDYDTLDVALGYRLHQDSGWYVQGGIKNITDTLVKYPSFTDTYPNDYPIGERFVWFRTGWRF